MKVLTFGWDYPPQRNGGLGVASFGLTRALREEGLEVTFVLPKTQPVVGPGRFIFADVERVSRVSQTDRHAYVGAYSSSDNLVEVIDSYGRRTGTFRTLLEEVYRYARQAAIIAREEEFDVIHVHDWTSYLAGVAAKRVSGKPLVLHVHATSYDQAGGDNVDPEIYNIEHEAFLVADQIVAISQYTKDIITRKHGVSPGKVSVVHNGHDMVDVPHYEPVLASLKAQGKKIVLYHGRITIQKGVDYFVRAARRVVDVEPNVVFVISGWGDMTNQIIEQVGAMGLSGHVIFAGSLWDEERDRMYQSADLVVMPSVSEPFGLVPLEALQNGAASLISKQSGVREVVKHVLVVDFWDVEDMANKIVATLRYSVMREQLIKEGRNELRNLPWREAARKMRDLFHRLVQLVAT